MVFVVQCLTIGALWWPWVYPCFAAVTSKTEKDTKYSEMHTENYTELYWAVELRKPNSLIKNVRITEWGELIEIIKASHAGMRAIKFVYSVSLEDVLW